MTTHPWSSIPHFTPRHSCSTRRASLTMSVRRIVTEPVVVDASVSWFVSRIALIKATVSAADELMPPPSSPSGHPDTTPVNPLSHLTPFSAAHSLTTCTAPRTNAVQSSAGFDSSVICISKLEASPFEVS